MITGNRLLQNLLISSVENKIEAVFKLIFVDDFLSSCKENVFVCLTSCQNESASINLNT